MKKMKLFAILLFNCIASFGQTPNWAWAKSADNGGDAVPTSITAKDNFGNVYITGMFSSSTITFGNNTLSNNSSVADLMDIYIVKYDPSGNVLWAKSAGGIYNENSGKIAIDGSGNVFITGVFLSPTITFDSIILMNSDGNSMNGAHIFIAKYDSFGNILWAKDAGGGKDDVSNSIIPDSQGNVYLTGQFIETLTFGNVTLIPSISGGSNFFIAKYDSSGNVLWAKSAEAFATHISTDVSGNLYITGVFQMPGITIGNTTLTNAGSSNAPYDIFIAKYDSFGDVLWAKSVGGNSDDFANDIASDASGNIYITGAFESSSITFGNTSLINGGNIDIFITKYDPSGNVLWAKSAGGNNDEVLAGITIDGSDNIYITGIFSGSTITFGNTTLTKSTNSGLFDFFITKYDLFGNVTWAKSLSAGAFPESTNISITADEFDNIYVTGYWEGSTITFDNTVLTNASTGGLTWSFIAKLSNTGVGINETGTENSVSVYPNPFSNTATINFKTNGESQECMFDMFDVLGNKIKSIEIPGNINSFKINRDNLTNGIYFYQIISDGKNSSSGKLIIQ